jgi:tRNA (mo5U34)-methyltransferase
MTVPDLERRVAAHRWYHSIDLGGGIVTRGIDDTPVRLARLDLPASLEGLSVLDIGAWDGFFSFECERRGAGRVVATDYYSWHGAGWGAKAGFELARKALGSRVEDVDIDVMDISPERLGTFDVVLFLGVLYHLRHPLLAIDKIAAVTRGTLILETVVDLVGLTRPAMAFYPDRELNADPTNWWGPNQAAVVGMLKSAGFDDVSVVSRTPGPLYRGARAVWHRLKGTNQLRSAFRQDRAVFHARKRQPSQDRMI